VTGGGNVNGYAYDIPAAVAWETLPVDTTYQASYSVTASSWAGGTETLTVSGLPGGTGSSVNIMGGFQLSGYSGSCIPTSGVSYTGRSDNEILITGESSSTIQYALGSNPGSNACTGTLKWPDVRQFDERVYQADTGATQAATPTFSPPGSTYTQAQSVTISTTLGSVICWSTSTTPVPNGSTGCTVGTLYTAPVPITANSTLQAVAGGTGYTNSATGSAIYVINYASAPTPGIVILGQATYVGQGVSR
jgi:hypothetical protein